VARTVRSIRNFLVKRAEEVSRAAAVAAIKEKGVLSGQRIERTEVGAPGEFETMIDEQLERALLDKVMKLGLEVSGTQH
jgi:hypothetical protein